MRYGLKKQTLCIKSHYYRNVIWEDRMLEIYIKILQQLETEEVLFVTDHKTKLVKLLRLGRLLHHATFFSIISKFMQQN